MFWSKNNRTDAIRAGKAAAHLAQTGNSKSGINHGRPLEVANVFGMLKHGKAANSAPWVIRAHLAMRDAAITPIVGAKSETVFRMDLLKNIDCRSFFSDVASVNVVAAQINDRSAFGKVVTENVLAMSVHASKTNMKLIRTEKVSSVNLVRYFTELENEVMEETNKISAVHNPVHE
jgi:hypothetical protein